MRARAKSLDTIGSDIAKAGTEAMLRELVEVTPVDTSTALSNWQISLGVPVVSDVAAASPGRYGSTRGASADKTIADGLQKLQSKTPGETIFLSNLTPYIGDLNDGSSAQFAGGFIPRALIVFRLAVQDAKKRMLR
jgi:hypothetical protein